MRRQYVATISLLLACSDGGTKGELDASTLPAGDGGGTAAPLDGASRMTDARIRPPRDATSSGDGAACNHAELSFDPRPPTTVLLVDRSSSMFDNKLWEPLKAGVLSVVQQLSSDVRFGFASYTGKNGGMCPDMTQVAVAEDNYAAIAAAYNALPAPPYKGETPTASAVAAIASALVAQEGDAKSIVLVTDGEPDFCDDGNVTCARDAVVAAVQAAYRQDVRTFILSIGGQVAGAHLRDVANAGVGQGVVDHNNNVKNQCTAKATYGTSEGSAPYFEPDVANQAALIEVLAGVVARTRSCSLDLAGRVRVDLDQAERGTVSIDDVSIPYGGANGFRMNTATELELLGTACERIRTTRAVRIAVDYPCEAITYL
ncbi:MAG TPA: VWA domain-containing protein [Polyangiales bacterium]|nr:VWA domain-containing protein [Polyangiales bacterium]